MYWQTEKLESFYFSMVLKKQNKMNQPGTMQVTIIQERKHTSDIIFRSLKDKKKKSMLFMWKV